LLFLPAVDNLTKPLSANVTNSFEGLQIPLISAPGYHNKLTITDLK
jgi:hypothetical protein